MVKYTIIKLKIVMEIKTTIKRGKNYEQKFNFSY